MLPGTILIIVLLTPRAPWQMNVIAIKDLVDISRTSRNQYSRGLSSINVGLPALHWTAQNDHSILPQPRLPAFVLHRIRNQTESHDIEN